MKVSLLALIFLGISIFSFAQVKVSYIETSLGKTPIYTGGYVIPPGQLQSTQKYNEAVNSKRREAVSKLLNKNNELIETPPDRIYVYDKDGDYVGFFAYREKKNKTIVTAYDALGHYLIRWVVPKINKK